MIEITFTICIKQSFRETIMGKYIIELNGEIENMLAEFSAARQMSPEQFIQDIVNRYLPLSHKIDQEAMAKGYSEMSEINSELAK